MSETEGQCHVCHAKASLQLCAWCEKPRVHIDCWQEKLLPDGISKLEQLPAWVHEAHGGSALVPTCSLNCQLLCLQRYRAMGGGKTAEMTRLENSWLAKLKGLGTRPTKGRGTGTGRPSEVASSPEGTPTKTLQPSSSDPPVQGTPQS